MKVLKFGGTSMGSSRAMNSIYEIVENNLKAENKILLACSAVSGITNALIELGSLAYNLKTEETLIHFNAIKQKHYDLASELNVLTVFDSLSTSLFFDLHDLI